MNNAKSPNLLPPSVKCPEKALKLPPVHRAVDGRFAREPAFLSRPGLTGPLALPKYGSRLLALTSGECCSSTITQRFQKLTEEDPNEIPSAWRPRRGPPHQG